MEQVENQPDEPNARRRRATPPAALFLPPSIPPQSTGDDDQPAAGTDKATEPDKSSQSSRDAAKRNPDFTPPSLPAAVPAPKPSRPADADVLPAAIPAARRRAEPKPARKSPTETDGKPRGRAGNRTSTEDPQTAGTINTPAKAARGPAKSTAKKAITPASPDQPDKTATAPADDAGHKAAPKKTAPKKAAQKKIAQTMATDQKKTPAAKAAEPPDAPATEAATARAPNKAKKAAAKKVVAKKAAAKPAATTQARTKSTAKAAASVASNAEAPSREAAAETSPARPDTATTGPAVSREPDRTGIDDQSSSAALWAAVRSEPRRLPAALALAAVRQYGEAAEHQAAWLRSTYPQVNELKLARIAHRNASFRGRVAALASVPFAGVGGLPVYAWAQLRLILELAAIFGHDARDPRRGAEMLVLMGVYHDLYDADSAIDAVLDTHRDVPLLPAFAVGVMPHAARRLLGRVLPGAGVVFDGLARAAAIDDLARRATRFYQNRTAVGRR